MYNQIALFTIWFVKSIELYETSYYVYDSYDHLYSTVSRQIEEKKTLFLFWKCLINLNYYYYYYSATNE